MRSFSTASPMGSVMIALPSLHLVCWLDAHGSTGTMEAHEVEHKPYGFTTVGFLVRSDDVGVSIASEVGEDGKYRDVTFIPRGMITSERPLPRPTKPRARRAAVPARSTHSAQIGRAHV